MGEEEKQALEDALKVCLSIGQSKVMQGLQYQGSLKSCEIAKSTLELIKTKIPIMEKIVDKARRGIALNSWEVNGPNLSPKEIKDFLEEANEKAEYIEDLLIACRGFSKMKWIGKGEGSQSASSGIKREKP